MIKRLALLCCILLLPTIAAAEGNTNYGDFWVGGQLGGVFTPNTRRDRHVAAVSGPGRPQTASSTDPAFSAGAIVGYNFCMPYRQAWERYFGVALDFQWNQFNHPAETFRGLLMGTSSLYPSWAGYSTPSWESESFTRGRIVPFLMFGPSVVWTTSDFSNYGGGSKTSTNFGLVAEVGVEFFVCPQLSIGPSFRYRHVFGPNYGRCQ